MLVFLLQRDRWPVADRKTAGPEIVFVRIAAPASPPHREPQPRRKSSAQVPPASVSPFVVEPFSAPSASVPNDLSGLHGGLFGCAPENLVTLTPEQRSECDRAMGAMARGDPNAVPWPDRQYQTTKNTWRWARNVARKNAPTLLPCASPKGINYLATALCLANAAVNGFDNETKAEYFDHPEPVGVPNGGDPPMMSDQH